MKINSMFLCFVMGLTLAQISLSHGATAAAESRKPDTTAPIPLNWRTLELYGTGTIGSVTTRIDLGKLSATDTRSALVDGPNPLSQRVAAPWVQELVVTNMMHLLLGVEIEIQTRLWFNEDDNLPLQLIRTRLQIKPSRKFYRFGNKQVYRMRSQPASSAETRQPPEKWSQISESFYPLTAPGEACPDVLESSQILYLLSRPGHEFGKEPEKFCVFARKHVYQVKLQVLGQERLAVDYLQVTDGQESRVRRTQEVTHVVFTGLPVVDAQGDVQPFSFLGLKGEIHILLSEPERIPLQIRGQVTGFGNVDLELKELIR